MKVKVKSVYYCDHCGRYGLSRFHMIRHELLCHMNPDNFRPCFGCRFLVKKSVDYYYDLPGGEYEMKVDVFYCEIDKIYMYRPQNRIKGNVFDLGEVQNIEMPVECEKFEKQDILF